MFKVSSIQNQLLSSVSGLLLNFSANLLFGFEILHDLTIFAKNLSETTWAK
jgi:hypothetical protein